MEKVIDIKLLTECKEHMPTLAHLWFHELSKRWNPNASLENASKQLIEHLNETEMPMTWVALCDQKAVGMVSLRADDGLGTQRMPWLGSLVVCPDYRRGKIGERLIAVAKKGAQNLGYSKIYLFAFDKTIVNWYGKLGWEIVALDQFWGHPVTVMASATS